VRHLRLCNCTIGTGLEAARQHAHRWKWQPLMMIAAAKEMSSSTRISIGDCDANGQQCE